MRSILLGLAWLSGVLGSLCAAGAVALFWSYEFGTCANGCVDGVSYDLLLPAIGAALGFGFSAVLCIWLSGSLGKTPE